MPFLSIGEVSIICRSGDTLAIVTATHTRQGPKLRPHSFTVVPSDGCRQASKICFCLAHHRLNLLLQSRLNRVCRVAPGLTVSRKVADLKHCLDSMLSRPRLHYRGSFRGDL